MIEESQASPVSPRVEERSSPVAGPSVLELVAIEVFGQDQSWADDTESELLSRQPDASPVPPESFEIGVYDTGQSWADQVHDELLSRQAATMPSASSNWMRRPASPTASPLLTSLKKLAEDASVLLELLCQTMPVQEDDIAEEHTQMAAGAAASILEIETGIRRIVARRNGDIGSQRGLDAGDTRIDAACIICYSEIADTVFMPCRHLALCGVGFDVLCLRREANAGLGVLY